MADNQGNPDGRVFLGIPGWVWDRIFAGVGMIWVSYVGLATKSAIETNGEQQVKHAEAQIAKLEEVKTENSTGLSNVAAKVDKNTEIVAANVPPPPVVIQSRAIIEYGDASASDDVPAADEKPTEEKPPGIN